MSETVYKLQDVFCAAFENNSCGIGDSIKGEPNVVKILVADPVTKVRGYCIFVFSGDIEDHAHFGSLIMPLDKKIIHQAVILCQNARPYRRMRNEGFNLLDSEVPSSVDFFALKNSGGNIISEGAIGKSSDETQLVN